MVKNLVSKSQFAELAGVSPAAITKACKNGLAAACVGKKVDANHPLAVAYCEKQDEARTPPPATGLDALHERAVDYFRNAKKPTPGGLRLALGVGDERARALFDVVSALKLPEASDPPPMPPVKPPRVVSGVEKRTRTKKSEALENIEQGRTLHQVPEEIEKFADMTLRELIERFGSDYAFCDWLKAMKSIEEINEKRLKNATTRGELVSRDLVKRGVIDPIESAHIKLLTDGAKTIARRVVAMTGAGRPVEDAEKFVAEQITSFIRPIKTKVARALKNA